MNFLKSGVRSTVLEQDQTVGGISRTVNFKNYYFDLGGHRFFTKVKSVENMWKEVLGEDFLLRDRLSRIYYNKKFFYYPLRPLNALLGLGSMEQYSYPCQLSLCSTLSIETGRNPRTMGFESLWATAIQNLLQDLYGKSLGNIM